MSTITEGSRIESNRIFFVGGLSVAEGHLTKNIPDYLIHNPKRGSGCFQSNRRPWIWNIWIGNKSTPEISTVVLEITSSWGT
jgi:hypothetical protein